MAHRTALFDRPMKNWYTLVRIIVAIIYASDGQLGYDLDMQRIRSSESQREPQFDITVRSEGSESGPTIHRTIEMLSDVGTDSMLGRGTRVWEVQKLANGHWQPQGPFFALKDV